MKFGLKTLETNFDVSECRGEQRRLQTRTLPVTYARVRDKAVGVYRLVYGNVYGEAEGVGRNILFGVLKFGLKTRFAV